jgi:hypothetical protein
VRYRPGAPIYAVAAGDQPKPMPYRNIPVRMSR